MRFSNLYNTNTIRSRATLSLLMGFVFNGLYAQQQNVWPITSFPQYDIQLNFNYEPPKMEFIQPIANRPGFGEFRSIPMSLCDETGSLILYSRNLTIHFPRQQGDSIILPITLPENTDPNFSASDYVSGFSAPMLGVKDNTISAVVTIVQRLFGVGGHDTLIENCLRYLVRIEQNSNSKFSLISCQPIPELTYQLKVSNYKRNIPGMSPSVSLKSSNDNHYWIFSQMDSNRLVVSDFNSLNGEIENVHNYSIPGGQYAGTTSAPDIHPNLAISNSRELLAIICYDNTYELRNRVDGGVGCNALRVYKFNYLDGSIDTAKYESIFESHQAIKYYPIPNELKKVPENVLLTVCFSPNDSILYTVNVQYENGVRKVYPSQYNIQTKESYHQNIDLIAVSEWKGYLIGPNGRMYCISNRSQGNNIVEIKRPDIFGSGCQMEKWQNDLRTLMGSPEPGVVVGSYLSFWPQNSPYKRATFTSKQACTGKSAVFTNTSDSIHWVMYRFYFGDGDSAEMNNDTRLANGIWGVEHSYTNPGKYYVKMKAFTKQGGFVWYSDTVDVLKSPVASFVVDDTVGCQWLAYDLTNTSTVYLKGKPVTYVWNFGDGKTQQTQSPNVISHTYTASGNYVISLAVNDGFCKDTFNLNKEVEILVAPRPGITLESNNGCVPFLLKATCSYPVTIDSIQWNFGDGVLQSTTTVSAIEHEYSQPGKYQIQQTLFGPTGCVTRDTASIDVLPGFEKGYTPKLILASVEEDSVYIFWNTHTSANAYQLFQNGKLLTQTEDSTAVISYEIPQSVYTVRPADVCGNLAPKSNIGKLIELTGEQQNNEVALVQWSAYEEWPLGVKQYILEAKNFTSDGGETIFQPVAILTDSLDATDENFRQENTWQRCYRISAVSREDENVVSHSNVLCLPYEPVFFVPSAFSPNGDNLNDEFKPYAVGIKTYQLIIYNRWGEKLYEGTSWDGKFSDSESPAGEYFYSIEATNPTGKKIHAKGMVMLVR
ncbi:MAG: PKD domain-containing protein [Bacteroidetes bacterium]|nr:PKD domain-containing protein [Bacteroidota bacterium]